MKKLFLVLLGIVSIISLKAQSDNNDGGTAASRSVYLEVLGGGVGFSANFDSRFSGQKGFGYRVGIGMVPVTGSSVITIPIGFNYMLGRGSSHFVAEVTGTYFSDKNVKIHGSSDNFIIFYPHIGYRYTKPTKSFMGGVYVGPLILGGNTVPWLGLSLGYTL